MKILVVEDERKIRLFLKKHLEPEHYEVDTASDGKEGLRMMRMCNYDVVLLDNVLPKKKGLEVCKEARDHGVESPIIMVSVLGKPTDKAQLLDAGADDYLAKPFSFNELKARIRAVLRRPKQTTQEIMRLRDLELNVTTHEFRKAGNLVKLTRKELMLLRYFLRNPGIILSRSMIIEHVWDMNADPFSNTVEAHIVSLRKKIGSTSQEIIKTIAGRGYKIIAE